MPLYFEKPQGTKDILPQKMAVMKKMIDKSLNLIEKWGYEEIETPVVEYYQTVGLYSQIKEENLLKILDGTGETVVLRPDLTAPIARVVSSLYEKIEFPLRYMYQGKIYRNQNNKGIEETNQIGVELIGLSSLEGDAEIINLAIKTIMSCTDKKFRVLVGHAKFLNIFLEQIACNNDIQKELYSFLLNQNYVGYRNLVTGLDISPKDKEYLLAILKLRGNIKEIMACEDWFDNSEWRNIFIEFKTVFEMLKEYEIDEYVSFDLSLVGKQNYYTGLIYNGYCETNPKAICSGGRYDTLLESFERKAPATGFAINLDALVNVADGIDIKKEKVLIVFKEGQRLEAIKKAKSLREENKKVIIINSKDLSEKYIKNFEDIVYL